MNNDSFFQSLPQWWTPFITDLTLTVDDYLAHPESVESATGDLLPEEVQRDHFNVIEYQRKKYQRLFA